MTDYGIKISKTGEDVKTTADVNLLMSSKFPMFSVESRSTTSILMYKTTLSANINNVTTTIPLTSTTGMDTGMSKTGWIWVLSSAAGFLWEAISYTSKTSSQVSGGSRGYLGTAAAAANSGDTVIVGYREHSAGGESHGLTYPPVHFVYYNNSGVKHIIPETLDPLGPVSWMDAWVDSSKIYIAVEYTDENVFSHTPAGTYKEYPFIYYIMNNSITTPYY